jgi:hypothetical protein
MIFCRQTRPAFVFLKAFSRDALQEEDKRRECKVEKKIPTALLPKPFGRMVKNI